MKQTLSILITSILLISCNDNAPRNLYVFDYENKDGICLEDGTLFDSTLYYFPFSLFTDSLLFDKWVVQPDTIMNEAFSHVLYKMSEPILYNKYLGKAIYRISLIQSFSPSIVVRLEKEGSEIRMISKSYYEYLSNKQRLINEEWKTVIDSVHKEDFMKHMPDEFWNDFEVLITKNSFLMIPPTTAMDFGCDGDVWIIEKHDKAGYSFVKRSSFSRDKFAENSRNICDYLIKNSDVNSKLNNYR